MSIDQETRDNQTHNDYIGQALATIKGRMLRMLSPWTQRRLQTSDRRRGEFERRPGPDVGHSRSFLKRLRRRRNRAAVVKTATVAKTATVLKTMVGPKGSTTAERFSHSITNRFQAFKPSRPSTGETAFSQGSPVAGWGGELEMTLPIGPELSGPGLSVGSRISGPSVFSVSGQPIPPMSQTPRTAPRSTARRRPGPPRLSPKSRLFSQVEEVAKGSVGRASLCPPIISPEPEPPKEGPAPQEQGLETDQKTPSRPAVQRKAEPGTPQRHESPPTRRVRPPEPSRPTGPPPVAHKPFRRQGIPMPARFSRKEADTSPRAEETPAAPEPSRTPMTPPVQDTPISTTPERQAERPSRETPADSLSPPLAADTHREDRPDTPRRETCPVRPASPSQPPVERESTSPVRGEGHLQGGGADIVSPEEAPPTQPERPSEPSQGLGPPPARPSGEEQIGPFQEAHPARPMDWPSWQAGWRAREPEQVKGSPRLEGPPQVQRELEDSSQGEEPELPLQEIPRVRPTHPSQPPVERKPPGPHRGDPSRREEEVEDPPRLEGPSRGERLSRGERPSRTQPSQPPSRRGAPSQERETSDAPPAHKPERRRAGRLPLIQRQPVRRPFRGTEPTAPPQAEAAAEVDAPLMTLGEKMLARVTSKARLPLSKLFSPSSHRQRARMRPLETRRSRHAGQQRLKPSPEAGTIGIRPALAKGRDQGLSQARSRAGSPALYVQGPPVYVGPSLPFTIMGLESSRPTRASSTDTQSIFQPQASPPFGRPRGGQEPAILPANIQPLPGGWGTRGDEPMVLDRSPGRSQAKPAEETRPSFSSTPALAGAPARAIPIGTSQPAKPDELPLPPTHRPARVEAIQRQAGSSVISAVPETAPQQPSVGQRAEDSSAEDERDSEPDLNQLAQQIYPLVKRMLVIERERRPGW
jgi:hypothetical protein